MNVARAKKRSLEASQKFLILIRELGKSSGERWREKDDDEAEGEKEEDKKRGKNVNLCVRRSSLRLNRSGIGFLHHHLFYKSSRQLRNQRQRSH